MVPNPERNDFDSILKDIVSTPDSFKSQINKDEIVPEDTIPLETAKVIIQAYAVLNKTSVKDALVGLTYLVQEGGTNSSKKNLIRTVNGVAFDVNQLRTVIRNNSTTGTVRQLAKTLRNEIAKIASINNWPGTLYKEINRISPELISSADCVYCCEIFSDCYDSYMPAKIRELLQQRERDIMDTQKKTRDIKRKPPKGKGKNKKKK